MYKAKLPVSIKITKSKGIKWKKQLKITNIGIIYDF